MGRVNLHPRDLLALQFLQRGYHQPAQGVGVCRHFAVNDSPGDGQRQLHHVGLGLAPQAGAEVGDFLNRTGQALDYGLHLRGGTVPAGDFALPRPRGVGFAYSLLISRFQLGYLD